MSGRRVGFCLSHKKRRRMNLDAFAEFCAGHGVEVVEIDLTQPLDRQGPFNVIVHKLSDVIVDAEHDSQSQQFLANFQNYVSAHPGTVLLDPLPAMIQLLDRFASYRIMSKLHNSLRDWRICSPPYLEVQTPSDMSSIQKAVMEQGLSFPLICKTRVAHGSLSHESFVNHGAVLHKVFVVGDRHFCVERPSLKNFPSGPCDRKTIFFNSHQVSKPESSSDLTALDEQMPCLPPPSSEAIAALVKELRVQLGMALFGVDIIINLHTHTLTIIDINIFPGNATIVTSIHTVIPSDILIHSFLHQVTKECPSFSPLCSATLSQSWTNRPLLASRLLALLSPHRLQVVHLLLPLAFKLPRGKIVDCAVFHLLSSTNKSHFQVFCWDQTQLFLRAKEGTSYLFVICNMS
ncbi:inositol-tetrakisphosphate 1-kinase-like isoform X2 [Anabas testudineus]|uniref:inositol-tetrakisphosphate 1-kinase-like isoform X2 n=1 Tax=Anabas testudineus TaxID=64144 RepID=UPI000E461AA7|nr:inositol-tetrakisphosphate 1-kinase-like isoform X2 [Anabas testudineus]